MSFEEANKSHYGNKSKRMHEGLTSARTIDKSQQYQDNGDFARTESIRVSRRDFNRTNMIFDNVVSKSVDTDRKVTGCSRSHYNWNNKSNFKLHYEDDEMDTTQKLWEQKKKNYGKLRDLMIKGNVDDYYHKLYTKSNMTKPSKITQDFSTTIRNVPGSAIAQRRKFKNDIPRPSKKKMNEICQAITYKQPINPKMYYSRQNLASAASLSTMHTQAEHIPSMKASKPAQHRYQFKRVHKLKYNV